MSCQNWRGSQGPDVQVKESGASQVALVVKNPPVGDTRDSGSIPGSGRSLGGGHGTPFQDSCLENPMDRGAWQATVHSIAESNMTEAAQHTHKAFGFLFSIKGPLKDFMPRIVTIRLE